MTSPSIRFARTTTAIAWLLFVLSFILPATNVLQVGGTPPGTPLTGWQAFTASISSGAFFPLMWIAEPRVLLFLIFPIANSLMLLVPIFLPVLRENSAFLAVPLLLCAVIPWFLPKTLVGDLFIGFYLWNVSFIAMSLGCGLATLAYHAKDNEWYAQWKASTRHK